MLQELVEQPESEWLDFKEFPHANNADLIHDILCMSNVRQSQPRILLIGVSNDKTRIGLPPGTAFKNESDITSLLRGAQVNRMPKFRVVSEALKDNKFLLGIEIFDSNEKPYFLLKEYEHQGSRVRAGAIYSRSGDSNTPKDSTAPDHLVEIMYRERFGLFLLPKERFLHLLKEPEKWAYEDDGGTSYFRYEPDPVYYIEEKNLDSDRKFSEAWTYRFPDPNAFRMEFRCCYHGIKLETYYDIVCDGGRVSIAQPEIFSIEDSQRVRHWTYYLIEGSHRTLVNDMMRFVSPNSDRKAPLPRFPHKITAERELTQDFAKACNKYDFYFHDSATKKWAFKHNGISHPLFY